MTTIEQAMIDNTIIRASAGSGKTTALSSRFLQLLTRGVHCQSILATTFTRKAAGEILDRIMTGLAAASLDDGAAQELSQTLQIAELDRRTAQPMLRHMLNHLHRLQIGTLDSFFAKLARSFPLELGLMPDWDIADERAMGSLAQIAVESVLSHADTLQLLHLMAKGVSIRGANELLMDTVNDLYSIFLDSTPGAWFQLQSHPVLSPSQLSTALEQLTGVAIEDKRMATARIDDVQRATAEDWDQFIQVGLAGKIVDGTNAFFKKPIPVDLRNAYLPLIDHVRGLIVNELKGATESTYNLLDQFRERFEVLKTETGSLGFDDVSRRLADLLDAKGNQSEANWTYRLDWNLDHLLLDEFQDTSPVQWQVLQPFARRVMRPETSRSFFCVGDMKQAIFGWRGGVAEVFDLVEQQFPDLHNRELTRSYRSSQVIIDTVNRIFENANHYEAKNPQINAVVQRWKERFVTHTTEKTDLPGYTVMERLGEEDDWFATIAQRIKAIYERSPNRTIAVLTRDNDEVKKMIFALHSAKIPASEEGGNPLTDSAAVLLILSLVQLGDHPHDSLAWFHVANSLLAAEYELPPCEVERDKSPATMQRVHAVAAAVRRELSEGGYGATVARWASILAPSCTIRELRRLQKLIELADDYDAEATLRPSDFVEFVQEQTVEDPTGSSVRVMTIHKAKGLEFDVVVLPSLSKLFNPHGRDVMVLRPSPTEPISLVTRYVGSAQRQLLPATIQQAYEQQFERGLSESICVLYVALTRAIHALHIFIRPKDTPTRQSMSGILLATLTSPDKPTGKTSGKLFEHGDPDWVDKAEIQSAGRTANLPETRSTPSKGFDTKKLTLAEPAMESGRGLSTFSPSQMTTTGRGTIGAVLAQATHVAAVERGTLLHACFARIQWLDDPCWQSRLLEDLRRRFPDPAVVESVVDEFWSMLQQPTISALLHRSSYSDQVARRVLPNQILFEPLTATVENERAFAVRMDQWIVPGTIDRLVLIHEGKSLIAAEVIEYKTDQLTGATTLQIDERIVEYQPQIVAYRRAVGQFAGLPLDRVFARLVFVGIDREFDVR